MEKEGEDLTPFWQQGTTTKRRGHSYNPSSIFLNSGFLVIFLLITAIVLLGFAIPSILSYTSQIFRPNVIKKSWNSLNIVLVLLAILLGFLCRNNSQDSNFDHQLGRSSSNESNRIGKSRSYRWYDENQTTDRMAMVYNNFSNQTQRLSLRRSSSSYPDLREVSSQWIPGDDQWRFYDDTQVEAFRSPPPPDSIRGLHRRRSWRNTSLDNEPEAQVKNFHVDTLTAIQSDDPPPASTQPRQTPPAQHSPPPPPPAAAEQRSNRAYKSVARKDKTRRRLENETEAKEISTSPATAPPLPPPPSADERSKRTRKDRMKRKVNDDSETKETSTPAATPPPPPPAPPPPPIDSMQQKSSTSDHRKRHSATKDFLNSLYHKKKKKQRQKSVENFDALLHQSQAPPLHFALPPPTSPPSVFNNLFSSKKDKKKKYISIPPKYKPSLPAKTNSFGAVDDASYSGGESPMRRIPPPPPLPPFKMPAWKFVVEGDFVKLHSSSSSRSGSPELDDVESVDSPVKIDGGDATASPSFCPSPDVDVKADSFISQFRAGLRLEKINSFKQKQGLGLSNLGRGPNHI